MLLLGSGMVLGTCCSTGGLQAVVREMIFDWGQEMCKWWASQFTSYAELKI